MIALRNIAPHPVFQPTSLPHTNLPPMQRMFPISQLPVGGPVQCSTISQQDSSLKQSTFATSTGISQAIQPMPTQGITSFQRFGQRQHQPIVQPATFQVVSQGQPQTVFNMGTTVQSVTQPSMIQSDSAISNIGQVGFPRMIFPHTVRAIAPKPNTAIPMAMNFNRAMKLPIPAPAMGSVSSVPGQGPLQIHMPIMQPNSGVQKLYMAPSCGQPIPQSQQIQFHSQIQAQNQPEIQSPVFSPTSPAFIPSVCQQSNIVIPPGAPGFRPVFVINQGSLAYVGGPQMPNMIIPGNVLF